MSSVLVFVLGAAFATGVGMAIDCPRSTLELSRGLRIASFAARGFVFGVCAWQAAVVVAALVAPGASVAPVMLVFAGIGVMWIIRVENTRGLQWRTFWPDRLTAIGCVGLVATASELLASNASTSDSFHYSSLAGLIGRAELDLAVWDTVTRSFGLSAVHAPSVVTSELYFDGFSVTIAVASSVMLFVSVASYARVHTRLQNDWSLVTGAIVVVLLWMPFIWRFNANYLNAHSFVAAVILMVVIWIRERTGAMGELSPDFWSLRNLCGLSLLLGSLAMTRSEGPYFAALIGAVAVWVGLDILVRRSWFARIATVAALFVIAALWQFFLLVGADFVWATGFKGIFSGERNEERADFLAVTVMPLVLYTAVGVLAVGLPLCKPARRPWLKKLVPLCGLAALLLANVAAFATSLNRGWESVTATYENVLGGQGGWGFLGATVLCVAAVLAFLKSWRTWNELTLLAYLPLLIVPLGVFRASAYEGGNIAFRVGTTDSMNRILLHFYPLALFTTTLFVLAGINVCRSSSEEKPEDNDAPTPQLTR